MYTGFVSENLKGKDNLKI